MPALLEELAAERADPYHHHPAVGRRRRAVDEAGVLEAGDQLGHSRLRLALARREVGEALGPVLVEAGHGRGGGKRQVASGWHLPEQPEEPFEHPFQVALQRLILHTYIM